MRTRHLDHSSVQGLPPAPLPLTAPVAACWTAWAALSAAVFTAPVRMPITASASTAAPAATRLYSTVFWAACRDRIQAPPSAPSACSQQYASSSLSRRPSVRVSIILVLLVVVTGHPRCSSSMFDIPVRCSDLPLLLTGTLLRSEERRV